MRENVWTENETKIVEKSCEDEPVKEGKAYRIFVEKKSITEPGLQILFLGKMDFKKGLSRF